MGEESRSYNDFPSTCQITLYSSPPSLKSALGTSYHILLGQAPPSPRLISPQKSSPWKNNQLLLFHPHQCPNNLLGPKGNNLHLIPWRACLYVVPLQRPLQEDHPAPRGKRPHNGSQHSNPPVPRCSAKTLIW